MYWPSLLLLGVTLGFVLIYNACKPKNAFKPKSLFVVEDVPITAKRAIAAFCLVTGVLSGLTVAGLYPSYRKAVDIHNNGRQVMASVVSISRSCGRGGCRYPVQYHYEVPDIKGKVRSFIGDGRVRYSDLSDIEQSGKLPIAYAPDEPDQSTINLRNFAFTGDIPSLFSMLYTLIGFSVGIGIAAIALSGKSIRRSSI